MILKYIGKHKGKYYRIFILNGEYLIEIGDQIQYGRYDTYERSLEALLELLEEPSWK